MAIAKLQPPLQGLRVGGAMGGPVAGGGINTIRIRGVAQRLGQAAADYSDALERVSRRQRRRRVGEQAPAEIPQWLIGQLFEMDADYADYAEALWALDQPPGTLVTAT